MQVTARFLASIALLANLVFGLAACGSSPQDITLDPTSSTTPSTTTRSVASTRATSSLPVSRHPVTATWEPITANLTGLASECGNLSLLSVRPDRDMLTVSVALRGLWSSEGGAPSWTALGNGAGSATIVNRGTTIVYDPTRPNTFWESGIYNGGGVYRTDDNGRTFRQLGSVQHTESLSVDLTDPSRRTLLSGSHELPAVFLSRDGGATWNDISRALPNDAGVNAQPLILDAQTYLLGTSDGSGAGVFRSTDGGASWSSVLKVGVKGRPLMASDGSIYWVTVQGAIVVTRDRGATWSALTVNGFTYATAPNLVELPDGSLGAVSRTVVVSNDRGATWRSVGPALPYIPTGFAYSRFRNAFYIWHFTCDATGSNPVTPDAIMRLDFDFATQ